MSVPQAMEWLIEHADDPAIDTPLPGQASPGVAGAEAPAEAAAGSSEEDEEARDELTEIFKKIRRKRGFRADARVRVFGPGSCQVDWLWAHSRPHCLSRIAGPAGAEAGWGLGPTRAPGAQSQFSSLSPGGCGFLQIAGQHTCHLLSSAGSCVPSAHERRVRGATRRPDPAPCGIALGWWLWATGLGPEVWDTWLWWPARAVTLLLMPLQPSYLRPSPL